MFDIIHENDLWYIIENGYNFFPFAWDTFDELVDYVSTYHKDVYDKLRPVIDSIDIY